MAYLLVIKTANLLMNTSWYDNDGSGLGMMRIRNYSGAAGLVIVDFSFLAVALRMLFWRKLRRAISCLARRSVAIPILGLLQNVEYTGA